MDIKCAPELMSAELTEFVDSLNMKETEGQLSIGQYTAFGRVDARRRTLRLASKEELTLTPLLFRTTSVVIEDIKVHRSGAQAAITLIVKLP